MESLIEPAAYYARHKSSMKQHKLGAVIRTKSGQLIFGWNKRKTHPRFASRSIHAEMACLLSAARKGLSTEGAELLVVRPLRSSGYGLAKPCSLCEVLLREAGISRIFYTTTEGLHGYET